MSRLPLIFSVGMSVLQAADKIVGQDLPRVHPQIFSPGEEYPRGEYFQGFKKFSSSLVDLEQFLPAPRPEQPQDLLSIAGGKPKEAFMRQIRNWKGIKLPCFRTSARIAHKSSRTTGRRVFGTIPQLTNPCQDQIPESVQDISASRFARLCRSSLHRASRPSPYHRLFSQRHTSLQSACVGLGAKPPNWQWPPWGNGLWSYNNRTTAIEREFGLVWRTTRSNATRRVEESSSAPKPHSGRRSHTGGGPHPEGFLCNAI